MSMLGLGLSFAKQTAARVFGFVRDGLKAYYRFYETTPDFLLEGSTSFDGTDDYIDCGNISEINSASVLTFTAWVKFANTSDNHTIISKYTDSNNRTHLAISGNTLYFNVSSGGAKYGTLSHTGTDWVHIAMVFNGSGTGNAGRLKGYIDGVEQTLSYTGTIGVTTVNNSTNVVTLGKQASEYAQFSLANVGVWDRDLSASEIESIRWRGSKSELQDTELTNLVSWYDLDSTSLGSDLWDSPASVFTSGTYNWATHGSNTIANVSNQLQATYVDNAGGAFVYFRDSTDLSSDLTTNQAYQLTFDSKYSGGSSGVKWSVSGATATAETGVLTTTMTSYTIDFVAGSTTSVFFTLASMGAGNVVTIDNLSLKPVVAEDLHGSNDGDIVGATVNADSYSGTSPFKPRIRDKAQPKMAVQLADGSTSFDGTDDYILVPYSTDFNFGSGAFTVGFWVKFNSVGKQYVLTINDAGNGQGQTSMYVDTDAEVVYMVEEGAWKSSTYSAVANEWHYYTIVRDGASVKFYVDGSVESSESCTSGALTNNSEGVRLGVRESLEDYLDGKLANVGIWSRALTQTQIQEVMFAEKYSGLKKSLGSEFIALEADRTFSSDTGNWVGNETWDIDDTVSGKAYGEGNSTNQTLEYRGAQVTSGKTYEIAFTTSNASINGHLYVLGGFPDVVKGDSGTAFQTSAGGRHVLTATANATAYFSFYLIGAPGSGNTSGSIEIDDVSIREVLEDDGRSRLISWYDLGDTSLGSELVTNGGFDSATTGWTVASDSGTASLSSAEGGQSGNCLTVTDGGATGNWQAGKQQITGLTVGRLYQISAYIKSGTSGNESALVRFRDASDYDWVSTISTTSSAEWVQHSVVFSATETSGYVYLMKNSATDGTMLFDTVSFKQVLATDSQGSNDGSIYGATTTTGYTSAPHGVVDPLNLGSVYSGTAINFDNSNDYLSMGTSTTLDAGTEDWSICVWINTNATDEQNIFAVYDNPGAGGRGQLFLIQSDGKLNFTLYQGGTARKIIDADVISTGEWIFLCATIDRDAGANGLNLYKNAVAVTPDGTSSLDVSAITGSIASTAEKYIGRAWNAASQIFDGEMSCFKIFKGVALTEAQVQEMYLNPEKILPTGVSASSLKLYLPMQEGVGSYAYDGSGNQNHGTLVGATWDATKYSEGYQSALVRSNAPMIFDGSGDYVSIADTHHLSFGNSTTDSPFTISVWAYNPSLQSQFFVTKEDYPTNANREYVFVTDSNYKIKFQLIDQSSGGYIMQYGDASLSGSAGQWNHFVATYSGNSSHTGMVTYLNGSVIATTGSESSYTAMENLGKAVEIGGQSTDGQMTGIINEVAIWDTALTASEVTALYGSGTTPLLPTVDSGNYASTDDLQGYWRNDNVTTWTDRANTGVASFDGTNDNLTRSDLLSSEYTMSGWVKYDAIDDSSWRHLFGQSLSGLETKASSFEFYYRDSSPYKLTGSWTINANEWVHIAVTNSSTTKSVYLNGVQKATVSDSSSYNPTGTFYIGNLNTGEWVDGQIAGTHVFDVALTSSEITELYAIDKRASISGHSKFSNCVGSWLMGAGTGDTTSTIQDQTSNNNDLTVNGANLVGYSDGTTAGTKAGILLPEGTTAGRDTQGFLLSDTTSISNGIRFDGSGQYIKIDDADLFQFRERDFTIELWAKFYETSSTRGFFTYWKDANNRYQLSDYGTIDFFADVGGTDDTAQVSNTRDLDWHHYAVVKEGSTVKIYIDASVVVTEASWASAVNDISMAGGTMYFGTRTADGSDFSTYNAHSLFDEMRIYHKALSATELTTNYNNGKSAHSN